MNWKAGEAFRAKLPGTMMLQRCGVDGGNARGHVCFVDQERISFYLEWGGGRWIEAQCDLGTFAANFIPEPFAPLSLAYAKRQHFPKVFPTNFF